MNCILFDLSYINCEAKAHEGVAIYAMRVLDGLSKECRENITLLVAEEYANFFKKKYPSMKILLYPDSSSRIFSIPYIRGVCKMLRWKRFINKSGYDIVYIPFAWSGNSLAVKAKKVITIHDLRPMRVIDRFLSNTWWFKVLGLKKVYLKISKYFFSCHLKNAWKVICISNYVRDDVAKIWPAYSFKLRTVYNGVSLSKCSLKPSLISENLKYILYVNSLAKYKNILTLIKAYSLSYDKLKAFKIVIVGKVTEYWNMEVLPYIKKNNLETSICHLNYVSDSELRWLYEHARVFVTTSIHEGFGYTPIEAAICKCPVISSRSESLVDVTANKLFYYSPATSEVKLSQCLEHVLSLSPENMNLSEIANFFKGRYNQVVLSTKIFNLLIENDI